MTTRAARPTTSRPGRAGADPGGRRRTIQFAWLALPRASGARRCQGRTAGRPGRRSKSQWTEPITWVDEEWRPDGVQVPASDSVAPTATGFFCCAVAKGSEVYIKFLSNPFFVLGVLAAIVNASASGCRAGRNGRPRSPTRSASGATAARSTGPASASTAAG